MTHSNTQKLVTYENSTVPVIRKSAEIARFPKAKLPEQIDDFGKACAALIWATFGGPSQYATCVAAASHLGCSPDTIDRILSQKTKSPPPQIMFACLAVYQSKTGQAFPIGGGFEIRITQAVIE